MVPDYVLPWLPAGMLISIVIYSTCGDLHYVGLNGLELLDIHGRPLELSSDQVFAVPDR